MSVNLNLNHTPYYQLRQKELRTVLAEKQKNGDFRSTEFFYKAFKKKKFHKIDYESTTPESFASQIDSMITVLNEKYDDKWDFTLIPHIREYRDEEDEYCYEYKGLEIWVFLHYPEFTIQNSREESAVIKDLIVAFQIKSNENNPSQLTVSKIWGTRASVDYVEWYSKYTHSHLPSQKPTCYSDCFKLKDFCLGAGTEIMELLTDMWVDDYTYDPITFEAFLYAIDSVVEWESLEGTPYNRFRDNVGSTRSASTLSKQLSEEWQQNYYSNLDLESLDVDFILSENRYKIKNNARFENFLKENILKSDFLAQKVLYIESPDNGDYIAYRQTQYKSEEDLISMFKNSRNQSPSIFIQGNELIYHVRPMEQEETINVQAYKVHPNLKDYAKQQLEQELFIKCIRKSTIDKQN